MVQCCESLFYVCSMKYYMQIVVFLSQTEIN